MCPHCDPDKLKRIEQNFRLRTFGGEWFIEDCDDTAVIHYCPICGRKLEQENNG